VGTGFFFGEFWFFAEFLGFGHLLAKSAGGIKGKQMASPIKGAKRKTKKQAIGSLLAVGREEGEPGYLQGFFVSIKSRHWSLRSMGGQNVFHQSLHEANFAPFPNGGTAGHQGPFLLNGTVFFVFQKNRFPIFGGRGRVSKAGGEPARA